jgi:CheY-like chemotaxis protein
LLLVDDEELFGNALRRYFSGRYEVEAITDPREALERVRAGERFLMALIDLQMPKMSGQEFLARLRSLSPDLARRSVVVTAGAPDQALDSFPGQVPPVVLAKPIDLARLAALLDAAAEAEKQ